MLGLSLSVQHQTITTHAENNPLHNNRDALSRDRV